MSYREGVPLPPIDELLATARVVSLSMRVPFRGVTVREAVIFEGPADEGEFAAFPEYDDAQASAWLASGIESAWVGLPVAQRNFVPVNATVPAVPADLVGDVLARFPGCDTAKVKVAERGQSLADDIARVEAVRAHGLTVRIDANGAWTVDEAERSLAALGALEYAEQPCRTVEELAELRKRTDVLVAADESIRKADDPFRVVELEAADIAVLKVAPLGGPRRTLEIADQIKLPVVISSALDTAVGINAGLATAAALPELPYACGLGTLNLFGDEVETPRERRDWWLNRLRRCHEHLRTNLKL